MQRLLITGGTGYLGGELVRLAQASGRWSVSATFYSHRPHTNGMTYHPLDLRDAAATAQTLQQLQPDVIIHTAYQQRGPDLHRITATGAGIVAQVACELGARLIHLSSDALFDGTTTGAYTEQDAPNPINPYGAAKAEAEHLVQHAHPDALLVRTSLIYGGPAAPRSTHEQTVLDAIAGTQDITFFTDELRCPVQVTDLAAGLLELIDADVAGILHLAGPESVSRYTFAQRIAEAYRQPTHLLRSAPSATSTTPRPRNCTLDSSRAQRLLQTRIRGVAEVLEA